MDEKKIQLLLEVLKVLNCDVDFELREEVKKALARKLIEINCLG